MSDNILTLRYQDMFSKYGFNDGDMPDSVDRWLESKSYDPDQVDWHNTLYNLVKFYLADSLDLEPGETLRNITSAHNPARVWDEDGNDVLNTQFDDWEHKTIDLNHVPWHLFVFEDNLKVAGNYRAGEESWDWFVINPEGIYVSHFNKETFSDAQERAEALATELNEANKPRFVLEHIKHSDDLDEHYLVKDTKNTSGWIHPWIRVTTPNTSLDKEIAQMIADKLNLGEFENE